MFPVDPPDNPLFNPSRSERHAYEISELKADLAALRKTLTETEVDRDNYRDAFNEMVNPLLPIQLAPRTDELGKNLAEVAMLRLTAATQRVTELEVQVRQEHDLRMDNARDLAAEQAAHLATQRALVDLWENLDEHEVQLYVYAESMPAITAARAAVAQADAQPVIKQSLTTEPKPRTCGECASVSCITSHTSMPADKAECLQPRADEQKGQS
jgi:hypothetical protein